MFGVVIFSVLVTFALASGGAQWKYGKTENHVYGPQDWKEVSSHCTENAQSPIDIEDSAVEKNANLKGLSLKCDNKFGKVSGKLTNNGHAPTLSIDKPKGTASLTGGPLGESVYKLEQLHFHFGCENDEGSEHTVNGRAFSGELHLVTYNTKYQDFATAADKTDGLSVIGVFFQKPKKTAVTNPWFEKVSPLMEKIRKTDSSAAVESVFLYKLVPELKDLSNESFYSYKGSLTTPPCYQSVNWIVLKKPVFIGTNVLDSLRQLKNHEKDSLCGNFRPTQPLNGRIVSEY